MMFENQTNGTDSAYDFVAYDLVRTGFSQGVGSRSDSYYDSDFRLSLGRKKIMLFAGREVRMVYKPKSACDRAPRVTLCLP